MAQNSKTLKDLQKQRDLDDKIENIAKNVRKGVKRAFKVDTKREKIVKGSLAALFLVVGTPYLVEEVTENDYIPLQIVEKAMTKDFNCTTISEKFQSKKVLTNGKLFRGELQKTDGFAVVDDRIEKKRDCSIDKKYSLKMSNGKTYEVEPNFMQGFSKGDLDSMWKEIRVNREHYFTTSTTITGRNIITGYSRRKPQSVSQ